MTLGQEQQFWEGNFGLDMEFCYVYTVTLNLKMWTYVKVMEHPWVVETNCENYRPIPTCQWKFIT